MMTVDEILDEASEVMGERVALFYQVLNKQREVDQSATIQSESALPSGGATTFPQILGSTGADLKFVTAKNNSQLHSFGLRYMPGCCMIAVATPSNLFRVGGKSRLNVLSLKVRERLAWLDGYTTLLITDTRSKSSTIESAGFTRVYKARNRRTQNRVGIWTMDLEDCD